MKPSSLILLLTFLSQTSQSQIIRNGSFDSSIDTSDQSKTNWYYKAYPQSSVERDKTTAHSEKYSLKITCNDSTKVTAFYQRANINFSTPKKMLVVAWVKTAACRKGAGLLLSGFAKNRVQVSYTSSRQQESLIKETTNWTKIELLVLLRPETTSLEIGACMYGSGTAWLDDISIEEYKENSNSLNANISAHIDTMIKFVKENALVSDSINWPVFTKELKTLAKGIQNYKQAELVGHYLTAELRKYNDNHSFFVGSLDAKEMNSSETDSSIKKVSGKYLDNNIGYINMPAFASLNQSSKDQFALNAQSLIAAIDTKYSIKGWIVDLRNNGGGNCWPMIAGLGPLIGEGVISYNITQKGDSIIAYYVNGESYEVENGKRNKGSKVLNPYRLANEDVPLAVLIGPNCGSSGENTALAFVGRKNTRLFGKPTAGYTKGNGTFVLPDGSILFISCIISTDRNGKKYPDRVFPDETVEEDTATSNDLTLDKAKKWLITMNVQ